jgi:hypothetical protein
MASVGILNGCFLYSFSCTEVPHTQKFADREREKVTVLRVGALYFSKPFLIACLPLVVID